MNENELLAAREILLYNLPKAREKLASRFPAGPDNAKRNFKTTPKG
jgi:hypothetical protein